MRCWFVCVLAVLLAWPQTVGAQVGEEGPPSAGLMRYAKNPLPAQLMLRASYYLYLDVDADGTPDGAVDADATSAQTEPALRLELDSEGEIQLEEPASSPAGETEAPDIDTLSQRAIEHYETQSGQSGGRRSSGTRSRGAKAGIAVGVILGVGLLGFGIGAAVAMSNWEFEL